jgi:Na+-translocating ferredoxin:NAD+ oxidoreductase RNF subunit RnfB
MSTRQIVHIDEELCNGCGQCVAPCAEGAITIVNAKAHVVREELCDGAGFCLGVCPTGALSIETREAPGFDAQAAEEHAQQAEAKHVAQHCYRCEVSEDYAVLLPCRTQGKSLWVCTHCLPALIHG